MIRLHSLARGGAAAGIVIVLASCGGEPGRVEPPEEPVRVTVSTPHRAGTPRSYPASAVSRNRAELATRISGTVERVPVEVGSRVRRGDTLVMLDISDIRARIEQARANAELARQSYRRISNLAEEGAATGQELDDAEARLDGAVAALEEARAQRPYAVLVAPYAAAVTVRNVDPGDLALPGHPVMVLEGMGALKVEADLPGAVASSVTEGDPVTVTDPAGGRSFPATVRRVVPALDPGSRRFRVEARFDDDAGAARSILPGSYLRLVFEGGAGTTRWIPSDAVIREGQLTGVFTVVDDRLRLRWVRLGASRDGAVELLAGPAGPFDVVRSPSPVLRDGLPVSEVERREWTLPASGHEGEPAGPEEAGR